MHLARGYDLKRLRRFQKAVEAFEQTCQEKLYDSEPFYEKGGCLLQLQKYQEAYDSYKRASVLKPAYAAAYYGQGEALSACKQHQDALDAYIKAHEADPKYPEITMKIAIIVQALHNGADAEERLDLYKRLLTMCSTFAPYHYQRGLALHQLGRYQDALDALDEALRLNPDLLEARSQRLLTQTMLNRQTPPSRPTLPPAPPVRPLPKPPVPPASKKRRRFWGN